MERKKTLILIRIVIILALVLADLSGTAGNMVYAVTKTTSGTKATSGAKASVLATPSTTGALRVKGTQLTDKKGNAVQLRGISTHGIAWYPDYINKKCLKDLKSWGANVVRLAMYTSEYGGYCNGGNKKELEALIEKGVKYAKAADMYVIIDWHILSDGNPNTYKSQAKKFFKKMSKKFSKYNNVIYEICNEPNGGTTWKEIKSYAKSVIPVIRKNDSDAVIIVGTPNWSQRVDEAAASPIKDYDNIMYALHFYAATHKDDLRSTMADAIEKGLPVFVSEYGICDASGSGAVDKASANKWIKLLDKYNVSYVAWNLSNKDETSSIIKSSVKKKSGFKSKDLTTSGKWLYNMLKKKAAKGSTGSTSGTKAVTGSAGSTSGTKNTTGSAGSKSTLGNSDLKITTKLTNGWQSDGMYYYQYKVTLKNISGKTGRKWAVSLKFNRDFSCSSGWNGNYAVKGKTLRITSVDYNGALKPNKKVTDIGFIVCSSGKLKQQ